MSEIELKRSAGFLDNAFITTASKSGGIEGLYRVGGATFSRTCFNATAIGVSPSKGTLPVSISYKTTPKE